MSITNEELCREVEESLADILEGLASARLVEHIAECDHCRDLKYEAERAAEAVSFAGADFQPTEGFPDRMLGLVLEQRPDGPSASGPSSVVADRNSVVASIEPATRAFVSAPTELASVPDTNATMLKAPTFLARPEELAKPLEVAEVDAPQAADQKVEGEHVVENETATKSPEKVADAGPAVIADPYVPTLKTMPLSAVADLRAKKTQPQASLPTPVPSEGAPSPVEAITGRRDTGSAASGGQNLITTPSASELGSRAEAKAPDTAVPDLAPPRKIAPTQPGSGNVVSLFRRKGFIAALVGSMAAAAAIGGLVIHQNQKDGPTDPNAPFVDGAWSGTVASITRAGDGAGGLEVCNDGCKPLAQGGEIKPGSTLRTDSKTRARVKLADKSWIALDRNSEVVLPAGSSREAKIEKGLVVASVENVDGAKAAKLVLPQGDVQLLGSKVAITVTDRRASIEVVRGQADIASRSGGSAKVRSGEEATLESTGDPVIAASATMSDVLEWSNESADEVDAPTLRGIGELRAKKPGSKEEIAKAVRLSKHSVKVRVVDVVARTEVDETFTNETDQELEGIFRFPLPPGAQIEKLSLEVDGKLIDGAFVDRDKGAAIWRGVIQNAAPTAPRPREEIIWVPGPWRDPALLEWQRGGRFELRIFPIPKKGSRRVVLTYTQVVPQAGGVRRFTYPLAHDASGSTKIDEFAMDVQVLGNDKEYGVETRGYQLAKSAGTSGGDRLTLDEKGFVPAGDLTLEYALPNRKAELTAWGYDMPADVTTVVTPAPSGGSPVVITKAVNDATRKQQADAEAKALTEDSSPYVAFAIRPQLPRFPESKDRLHVIVVDSSRSMVGESFARATHLASGIVREMDRRDQFVVLACDVTCQAMGSNGGRSLPTPASPSAEAAQQVESFLGSIEPDGGSNLVAAVQAARASASLGSGRELRVIYLGDGTPTVGATKPATVEAAVRHVLPSNEGSVIAVALGADADTTTLSSLARGAGGVMVPYVPGQRVSAAAVDVLAAAYGSVLSDVEVVLPSGVHEVSPRRLDPVPAGGETFVFARMDSKTLDGNVTIRGRVGSERFEQTFPTKVVASQSAGNAFVPRLFAATKIAELERDGTAEDRERIVSLSRRFQVASRHTSMIVLESEAMFKAFGLDKSGLASRFTGENSADSSSTDVAGEEDAEADGEASLADKGDRAKEKKSEARRDFGFDEDDSGFGRSGGGNGGGGLAQNGPSGGFASKPASRPAATATASPLSPPADAAAPAPPPAKIAGGKSADPFSPGWNQPAQEQPRPRQQNLVPMRRVFDRKATFASDTGLATEVASQLAEAEAAIRSTPDSRDRTVALYKALVAAGRIGEAQELTARWSQRDALDPEALLARADLAAANGDRERAFRILSGLADVRPGDKTVQRRLIGAFTQVGAPDLACNHRLALAEIDVKDVSNVAAALRCTQDQGMGDVASALRTATPSELRDRVDTASRSLKLSDPVALLGDVRVTATWNTPADLDIAIVDKSGRRFSWLGSVLSTIGVTAKDASSTSTETVAFSGLSSGTHRIEIVRASTDRGTDPVRGELSITLPGGEVRRVPFTLTGQRTDVGTLRVFFSSRLVPVSSFGGGGGWRGPSTF